MKAKTTTHRNSNSGIAVKRLAQQEHREQTRLAQVRDFLEIALAAEARGEDPGFATPKSLAAAMSTPQPIAPPTPFERVRDSVHEVLQLEIRVAAITDKLLGPVPAQQSDSRDLPPSNGAPIFELNEHASDITAAVRRMHEVLDRFNSVLPA